MAEAGHVDAPVHLPVGRRPVLRVRRVESGVGPMEFGRERVARPIRIHQKVGSIEIEPGAGDRGDPKPPRIGIVAARVFHGRKKVECADLRAERIEWLRLGQWPPERRHGGDRRRLSIGVGGWGAGPRGRACSPEHRCNGGLQQFGRRRHIGGRGRWAARLRGIRFLCSCRQAVGKCRGLWRPDLLRAWLWSWTAPSCAARRWWNRSRCFQRRWQGDS